MLPRSNIGFAFSFFPASGSFRYPVIKENDLLAVKNNLAVRHFDDVISAIRRTCNSWLSCARHIPVLCGLSAVLGGRPLGFIIKNFPCNLTVAGDFSCINKL